MHLAERMTLPDAYRARPYRGASDHPAMAQVLGAYRRHHGDPEMPTVPEMDASYAHLRDCDPDTDIVVIEGDGDVVGYGRTSHEDMDDGTRHCIVFTPLDPDHIAPSLFGAMVDAEEAHMAGLASDVDAACYRAYSGHPGPGRPPEGEAAWLEGRGYTAAEWAASLVRPHLDDIPDRPLPDGVEVRPVSADQRRTIWAAHHEAFRGEWDFTEPTEEMLDEMLADPRSADHSLWKVAWVGDQVVGQVKPYINHEENATFGTLRGYTEYISTHHDWRNRGIAGALLAMSLRELRNRGMTEAALGVDTNNPGGAFQLYTGLGFELQAYEAIYTRPI